MEGGTRVRGARERKKELDDGVASLLVNTAHSTVHGNVASHLPETLVTPDDTPGVLHEPVVDVLSVDNVSSVTDDENLVVEVVNATNARRVVVDTVALHVVEVRGGGVDGDGDRAVVGNGVGKCHLGSRDIDVSLDENARIADARLAVTVYHEIRVVSLQGNAVVAGNPGEGLSCETSVAARVAVIVPCAVQDLLLRKADERTGLDGPGTLERTGRTERPARTARALILGWVDGALLYPVDVGRKRSCSALVDTRRYRVARLFSALTTELVGVHDSLDLVVLHIHELRDAELVGDIAARVVRLNHAQVRLERGETTHVLRLRRVRLLVLSHERVELLLCLRLHHGLLGRVDARQQAQTQVAVEMVRALLQGRRVHHRVRCAQRWHVEVLIVHHIGAVVLVVDHILVRMRTEHKVEATHVQTQRMVVVRIHVETIRVREVVLHISPLPEALLTVGVVTFVNPLRGVHLGQHIDEIISSSKIRHLASLSYQKMGSRLETHLSGGPQTK